MDDTYQIYLVSDSTGETLDRIFLALKAQFPRFKYKSHQCSFTRTENQILKIFDLCKNELLWDTNLKNGVCGLEFDRKDIIMNKLVATTLEGNFHVFDMRTLVNIYFQILLIFKAC